MVALLNNTQKNVLKVLGFAPKLADGDTAASQRQSRQLGFSQVWIADPDLPAYPAVLRDDRDAGHPGLAAQASFHRGAFSLDGQGESNRLISGQQLFDRSLRYQRTQPREGAAFVYLGSRRRRFSDVWVRVPGKGGSWYGSAGTSAGDVNGDGFPDFIVSAPSWDTEARINVGQVELFLNTRKR